MKDSFWKHNTFWWVPIVVLLLSGAGWAVKEYIVMSSSEATIFGKINNCPGEVSILIDGEELTKTSKYGHYRLDGIKPGKHEIQWKFQGYETKYAIIDIQGGMQNGVDLSELSSIESAEGEYYSERKIEDTLSVRTKINTWYAGARYSGIVDMQDMFGFSWMCSGGTCTLSGPYGTGLNMSVCQELSRRVGGLEYYYNDAGMKWTKTENISLLEQCNTGSNIVSVNEVEEENNVSRTHLILNELVKPISNCLQRNDTDHPSFHGCVDWHSSVHATWALIRYRMVTGNHSYDNLIENILTPNNINIEYKNIQKNPVFEMPYGRAWFLRMVIDYEREFNSLALKRMGDYIASTILEYYLNTHIDPYKKSYSNPSWALINLYQYGVHRDNNEWKNHVVKIVNESYMDPSNKCRPTNTSDSLGFIDVCGNWEYLVAETNVADDFSQWLDEYTSESGMPAPITEPKDIHEKGLNFSRAWSSWYAYNKSNNTDYRDSYIDHMKVQLENIDWWSGEDYSVTHWVAQFGIYALTPMYN